MILFWVLTVCLAAYFGFELGRRAKTGRVEAEVEAFQAREEEREGVKLKRIVMRR
jgi:hypothetical protein